MQGFKILGWLIVSLSLGSACAHNNGSVPRQSNVLAQELQGAPQWLMGDCRDYFKASEGRLCAVGSVGNTSSISIARSGAATRARAELARSLQVSLKNLIKDYQSTAGVRGGDQALFGDEQQIDDVTKQLSNQVLSGTRIETSWVSSVGTYYVLVSLDSESFKRSLGEMKTLSAEMRRAIEARADGLFQELEDETSQK